jgi:acyl carrier protein
MDEIPLQSRAGTQDRIMAIAADVFELEVDSIDVTMGPDDVDRWDSMNHLRLITEVENTFSIHLSMQQIQQIRSLDELSKCVSESINQEQGTG